MPKDVILCGVPRGGTTLAAALIDGLPDCVCLNEPGWQTGSDAKNSREFAQWLTDDFARIRKALLAGSPVPDRRGNRGEALTNYYKVNSASLAMEETFKVQPFTRTGLSADFTLTVKHNGPYLSVLDEIVKTSAFEVIAIVRHPLPVIASWRRLSLPISRGQMPNAVRFWPELRAVIEGSDELLIKQVKIYDLMCKRLFELGAHIHLIAYEELVKNPQLIAKSLGIDAPVASTLIEKPAHEIAPEEKEKILAAIARHASHYRRFYPEG